MLILGSGKISPPGAEGTEGAEGMYPGLSMPPVAP